MEYSNFLPSYLVDSPYDLYNRKKKSIFLPTKLNKNDCAGGLTIEDDGLTAFYNVQEISEWYNTAAAVRANYPLPVEVGLFYFEVYIINQGLRGLIGIGMSEPNAYLDAHPGWNWRSYGYHGDDGKKFISQGWGYKYGPLYTTEDTIGCCVNFFNGTCFYTKNGIHLGVAFDDISGGKLHPSIGMRTQKARVEVNFGQKPFVFDIDQYAKKIFQDAEENNEWAKLIVHDE